MVAENFHKSLMVTLEMEGGFSSDPADHGGRTMRGITQREYNAWRIRHGKQPQDVKSIGEDELETIYRDDYWNAVQSDNLPAGLDLAVFDYAVNSGPKRAILHLQEILKLPQTGRLDVPAVLAAMKGRDNKAVIDAYMDRRAVFLRRIGVGSQSVFLKGWLSRVRTVRTEALALITPHDSEARASLSMGAKGPEVKELQRRLAALGYPAGRADGVFGPQTRRAVLVFQDEENLDGDTGVWDASYWAVLDTARHILPERAGTTEGELHAAGDQHIGLMLWLQRILVFFGLGTVSTGTLGTFGETVSTVQNAWAPLASFWAWCAGNQWALVFGVTICLIVIVRYLINARVEAVRQGVTA